MLTTSQSRTLDPSDNENSRQPTPEFFTTAKSRANHSAATNYRPSAGIYSPAPQVFSENGEQFRRFPALPKP
jgi:hypothetical protein